MCTTTNPFLLLYIAAGTTGTITAPVSGAGNITLDITTNKTCEVAIPIDYNGVRYVIPGYLAASYVP